MMKQCVWQYCGVSETGSFREVAALYSDHSR